MDEQFINRHPIRVPGSVLLILIGAAAMGGADQASSQPAAGGSPTSRVPADHSAPDKTWNAMCEAVKAGDRAAFRACCYNHNEISLLFVDAYCDTIITTYQLATATAQLGDEGKVLGKSFEATYNDLVQVGKNRKVDGDEETAIWIQADPTIKLVGQRALFFKKVNNEWLLDTNRSYSLDSVEGRKVAEDFLTSSAPQLKLLKAVIADLVAKKISTVDQLRERLSTKLE